MLEATKSESECFLLGTLYREGSLQLQRAPAQTATAGTCGQNTVLSTPLCFAASKERSSTPPSLVPIQACFYLGEEAMETVILCLPCSFRDGHCWFFLIPPLLLLTSTKQRQINSNCYEMGHHSGDSLGLKQRESRRRHSSWVHLYCLCEPVAAKGIVCLWIPAIKIQLIGKAIPAWVSSKILYLAKFWKVDVWSAVARLLLHFCESTKHVVPHYEPAPETQRMYLFLLDDFLMDVFEFTFWPSVHRHQPRGKRKPIANVG